MPKCDHAWGPYDDVPYGERPERFAKCAECGVIGYIRLSAFHFGDRRQRRVQPYVCGIKGCQGEAVGRLKGRRGPRNNFVYVCVEHVED